MNVSRLFVLIAIVSLVAVPAAAQGALPQQAPGEPSAAKPGLLAKIGIDQRLNEQIPLDLEFVDETGRSV